jgi:hypothetical protein
MEKITTDEEPIMYFLSGGPLNGKIVTLRDGCVNYFTGLPEDKLFYGAVEVCLKEGNKRINILIHHDKVVTFDFLMFQKSNAALCNEQFAKTIENKYKFKVRIIEDIL